MSLQKLIEERNQQFDKIFPPENNLPTTHRGELDPEKIVENNHRQVRNYLKYQIKQFHSETINLILEGVVEMCKEMKKQQRLEHDLEGKCGFDRINALNEVIIRLQTLKK